LEQGLVSPVFGEDNDATVARDIHTKMIKIAERKLVTPTYAKPSHSPRFHGSRIIYRLISIMSKKACVVRAAFTAIA
jgi:hypothetical protein